MGRAPSTTVLEELDEDIVVLRLNRPGRHNAMGPDMGKALVEALDRWTEDNRARACVLTGTGDAFSSGADLGDETTHRTEAGEYLAELEISRHAVIDRLLQFPKPMIAAVNGYAIGWGFLASLACDMVLASESAVFRLPQTRLGLLPAYGGTGRLAQWVGRGRAFEIAVRGRPVTAEEGLAIGLVSSISSDEGLDQMAREVASELAGLPPLAYKLTKESLYTAMERGPLGAVASADRYRLGMLQRTDDLAEAHEAWREKRPPEFRNR